MEVCILPFLENNLVSGAVLAHAEEDAVRELKDEIMDANCENDGGGYSRARGRPVKVGFNGSNSKGR